tara:strand:- start:151 stop:414 length:264 start_codon:yes stop_codon:yes gene_type:complete
MKDPNFAKLISFKIFGLAFSKIFNRALIITGRKKIINKLLLIKLNILYLISFIKTDYYLEGFYSTNKVKENKTSSYKSYLIEGNMHV